MKRTMLIWITLTIPSWQGCSTDSPGGKVTVCDTFAGGWKYHITGGWSISGKYSDNTYNGKPLRVEEAFSFLGKAGTVSDVWVSLGYLNWFRKPGEITFYLDVDSAGLPGRTLETWKVTDGFHVFDSTALPIHLKGSRNVGLIEGQKYWLRATADDTTAVAWDWHPDPAFVCPHTMKHDDGQWSTVRNETCSVFRVDAEN